MSNINYLEHRYQNLLLCRKCKGIYDPDVDEQRFCRECKVWIHEECMSAKNRSQVYEPGDYHKTEKLLKLINTDGFDSIDTARLLRRLRKAMPDVPVMRGHFTKGREPLLPTEADMHIRQLTQTRSWATTGTGRMIETWREWEKTTFPPDWVALLGQSFVLFVLQSRFKYFKCPSCRKAI